MAVERILAESLLDINAVLLRPDSPFIWASGWHSPIYCDNRRILSHPELRSRVACWLASRALELYPEAEVVAGVATGAISHGVLIGRGKMGKLIEATARANGDEVVAAFGHDDLTKLAGLGKVADVVIAGLFPPIGAFFSTLPSCVLGGCTVIMFGAIIVSGVAMLG